jgi:hypothetical protein
MAGKPTGRMVNPQIWNAVETDILFPKKLGFQQHATSHRKLAHFSDVFMMNKIRKNIIYRQ